MPCATPEAVAQKMEQPGVSILAVHVVLDHVDSEVIGAGKSPYRQSQQERDFPARVLEQDGCGGKRSGDNEQAAFQVEQS